MFLACVWALLVGWLVFNGKKNKEEKTFVLILLFLKHLLNVRVRMYVFACNTLYIQIYLTNNKNKQQQQQQNAISF